MFEQLDSYTIPVLHPIAVHFPIVLIVAAAVCVLIWAFRDRMYWLWGALYLSIPAFVSAIVALRTGEQMEEQSEGIAIVDQLVHFHEDLAEYTVWTLGVGLAYLAYAIWSTRRDIQHPGTRIWIRLTAVLIFLLVAGLVIVTGHAGGVMTWGVPS